MLRYRAYDSIRGVILQLRDGVWYSPPDAWATWANSFLSEQWTLDQAGDAYFAVTRDILDLPNGLTPEYGRAEAARLAARAAQSLNHTPSAAKQIAEAAAIFIALTPEEGIREP